MVEKVARSISCLALMEEIMNIIYEKWDEILETVKTEHELSDVSFKTWLKPLTIHSIDDQVVTILVPSQQVGLNYISKKYGADYAATLCCNNAIRLLHGEAVRKDFS